MPRWTAAIRVLVAWMAVSVSAAAGAEDGRVGLIAFRRLAMPDDVPAHLCTAIAQDRSGLLWFGTQGGLVRYDGSEWRVYRSNAADPSTLAGSYVRALLVASDGRLWVGTFSGGLSVFDPRTEKFSRFRVAYDRVEGLAEDREGRIWIGTTAGLDRLDPKTGRIEHFKHDANDARSIADDRVRGLLVDRNGVLWVGTRDGLQRWRNGVFERVGPELAGQYVIRLYEDRRGRIWAGTEEHGAAVVDAKSGAVRRIAPRLGIAPRVEQAGGLSHYWVYGFAEGAGDEMWIATFGGGVDVVDANTLAVIDRLKHDPVLDDTIGADRVGAVFRDARGVMWVGTWGEGLARHDPRTRAFRSLRFTPNRADGLTHAAAVRALEMRDGTIWVGTNGNGIDILDRDLKRTGGIRPDANDSGALSDGAITCLAQADDGTVWVATLNSSLHVRRPDATRFERIPMAKLAGGPIRTIAFGGDGAVWAGAAEGMVRIDPATLETRVYRNWPGAAKSSPAIESIVVQRDTVWIGTDNGLYAFDPRTETSVRIAKDASRDDALPENWVPDLMLARDGRLWAGTAGGAAVLTSFDGRIFENVSRKLGRAPSAAEALIEDDRGHVWIGPRLRVDPKRWTARELGPADGVAFRGFFIASRSRTRDGRLLFGSPEGLLVVDPRMISNSTEDAPVVATALRVEGKARAGASTLTSIALSNAERSFTLDFAALDFSAPSRLYRHRLEGLDHDWTVLGTTQHSLTYSRLPPGDYVLRVGAMNRDGAWSPRELRLPVTVLPAWHQTLGFRVLFTLLGAALLYAIYRLRVRQLRKRQIALEALVASRTGELQLKNLELAAAYDEIQEASITDPLTQLRNRRFLEQTIGADLEIAARGGADRDLVIVMIDLDHFKSVNDRFGHAAGDAVLVALAQVLLENVRSSDTVVRWGGEEFLIVVRFVDRSHAPDIAEKLRAAVSAHPFELPDGTVIHRTTSIGFAAWPFSPSARRALTFERVVDLADTALYRSKHGGRDAWTGVMLAETAADPVQAAQAFRDGVETADARVLTSLSHRVTVPSLP